MKALVLSGGRATRLRPITHTSAKQLVPVANKPILFYAIEAIRDAGIDEIGIIVGHTAEEVMAAVGNGDRWGVKITYIPQDEPKGLAHAVKIAEPFIGKDRFIMFLGDNLIRDGVTEVVQRFEAENANAHIMLAQVKNPQEFGVAELDGDRVLKLVEKPKEPKSNLALVGVYLFDSNIFTAVNSIRPSARGELEITDAIQWLIENGKVVHWHKITGWWKDTGKLEDLLEANRLVLENIETRIDGELDEESCIYGRVIVEKGAKVVKSVIRGPAIVGEDCEITNAYVGPFTAVYNRVKILGSEVEHSIILEDSCIKDIGARIEDSLIGKNVMVAKDDGRPRAYRLMLGDNSDVRVL